MIFRTVILCFLHLIALGVFADGIRSVSPGSPPQFAPSDAQQTQQTGKSSGEPAAAQTQEVRKSSKPNQNKQRVANLRRLRDKLQKQVMASLPVNLSPGERRQAQRYQAWLKKSARKLKSLADKGDAMIRRQARMNNRQTKKIQREIQQMNENFSLQYLQLQNELQQQVREYNLLSNIMKQRHETAKNAINNIR